MRIDAGGSTSSYEFHPPVTQTQTAPTSGPVSGIVPTDADPSTNNSGSASQTASETTAATIAAYDAAVSGTDDTMRNAPRNAGLRQDLHAWDIDQAKAAMDKAISDELDRQIPPGDRTSPDRSLIAFSQDILQRYAADPVARPAVVDSLLADPRVKAWVAQAAQNVGQPYQGIDPRDLAENVAPAEQAARNLQSATADLPPELAAAVVEASLPTIQKISELKLSSSTVPFSTVQGVLSSLGNDPRARAQIAQVASDYAKNFGAISKMAGNDGADGALADAIATSGNGDTRFARALADQLQGSGSKMMRNMAPAIRNAGPDGLRDYLTKNGQSPLVAYNQAHKAADEATQHLSELLARTGALTPEQEQNFIKAYMSQPENADVYKNEGEAAKKLADYMNANRDSLISAAGQDADSAKRLYECMQDLTQSGQGATSLSFIGSVNGDLAASKAFSKFSDYQGDFLANTIASAQGELLAEKNGDPKSAVNALLELAEPAMRGVNGADTLLADYRKQVNLPPNAKAPNVFDPSALAAEFEEKGAAGRGFAMASIMVGAYNGGNAESINSMITAYSHAGGEANELASGAFRYMADADRFGTLASKGSAAADFTTKFIPGLSVIANVTGGLQDLGKVEKDPVYVGAIIGDSVSVMGSVTELFPGGQLPGEFINSAGMLLAAPFQLAGSTIDSAKEEPELKRETKEYLAKANELGLAEGRDKPGIRDKTRLPDQADEDGLNSKTIDALVASDPGQVKKLQSLNMTAAEIQALGEDDPEWLQSTSKSDALFDLARASGVQGSEVMSFADAVEKDDPNFVATLPGLPSNRPLTDNELVQLISQRFPTAQAYVQATHPDLLGSGGATRRKADGDYDAISQNGPNQAQQLSALLEGNNDPAYQAQIINRLRQSQALEGWVKSISQADDGSRKAAVQAIQAAKYAGVFSTSPDAASDYLRELS